MSVEMILSFLNQCSAKEQLEFCIATQCAPVLKRVKASNLLVLKKGDYQKVRQSIQKSGILCALLYRGAEREVLLMYHYDLLYRHLSQGQVRQFLKKYGYGCTEVRAVLSRLRRRYQEYFKEGGQFPHEMGIILEYPVRDVCGFIYNGGKDFLLSGYWKVYHDQERAREVFHLYDEAREAAQKQVVDGRPLEEIAAF